ncbi:MAG: hypothetical protein ACK5NB_02500 [Flavobacteriaceae bacterium]
MKKIIFLFLFVSSLAFSNNTQPQVGDVLIINAPTHNTYKHINFPPLNIVAKRSGLANYKSAYGNQVVVKRIYTDKSGNTKVVLKRKDNAKLLGFLKTVKADYSKSIRAGELSAL